MDESWKDVGPPLQMSPIRARGCGNYSTSFPLASCSSILSRAASQQSRDGKWGGPGRVKGKVKRGKLPAGKSSPLPRPLEKSGPAVVVVVVPGSGGGRPGSRRGSSRDEEEEEEDALLTHTAKLPGEGRGRGAVVKAVRAGDERSVPGRFFKKIQLRERVATAPAFRIRVTGAVHGAEKPSAVTPPPPPPPPSSSSSLLLPPPSQRLAETLFLRETA